VAEARFFCLHPGCFHEERFSAAMRRHVFDVHGVGVDDSADGVDYGSEADVERVRRERVNRANVESYKFARHLEKVCGAEDFIWLCKAWS
jgi:hypothetical protein